MASSTARMDGRWKMSPEVATRPGDKQKRGKIDRIPRRNRRSYRPWGLEALEGRELLASIGVDYRLSGFRWDNPDRITYSIAPDGVFWNHGANQLNASFDAKFGDGLWEREIARALATWQAAANINIVPVGDSARDLDAPGLSQGDPRFGDIRIGGYAFPGNTTTLGESFFPPPNGTTSAGDVVLNTGLRFQIGADYDLYSVLLHETGHSLGLDHPTDPSEVLNARYGGVRTGLSQGDLAGIQSIYGPRQPDDYRRAGRGSDPTNAIDVSPSLNAAGRATLNGLSLSTIGDTTYFSVVAPSGARGSLKATAIATGTSLLSPKISVFDASGRLIAAESNPAAWSNTVTAEVGSAIPGQRYLVAVTGATSDVFAVGAYGLQLSFEGVSPVGTPPEAPSNPTAPPIPITPVRPITPPVTTLVAPDRFEGAEAMGKTTMLGAITQTTLQDLSLHAPGDTDRFAFIAGGSGLFNINAAGTNVKVLDGYGRVVAQGNGTVAVRVNRAWSTIVVEISSLTGSTVSDYALAITSVPTTATTTNVTTTNTSWNRWSSWRSFGARRWNSFARAQTTIDASPWSRPWSSARPNLSGIA